ncbi:conserved hypothetical protein [Vibrio crassostreae]|uniref:Uncharacterized protein n=1 Tax=Vibrio crassostreae TaxID=246167 RepID=A0ABP1WSV4_9VIBR|nr:conserved hypothetical protein [Vibrio crassostreae]CAK1762288.1 conserved hypothetical protein [Vibrio crassostreae]CAK1764687.1 conserved hypothetical protein [Vibrio crassostreae]CAK1789819.1 conserved hypothetical protein [Vibrio crassostreae]CAK1807099.1 conserved hypothetical protein [Vibrio crassostreae]
MDDFVWNYGWNVIKLLKLFDKLNLNEFAVLSHKLKKCELYTGVYSGFDRKVLYIPV